MNKLKLLSLFSGIGAFEKALKRQNINYELVNYCDNDKYASKAFSLMHNISEGLNLGDVTKVDEKLLPDFDLMTWGFPCTDISGAGRQKGLIDENGDKTRSGLYYDGLRILTEKLPKYSVIENVKALTQKKFKSEFDQILKDLENLGYKNYWQVLNAKNYGVPQNRERVFIISILGEHKSFKFPEVFDNGLRLRDLLEDKVDERYYISDEKTKDLIDKLKKKEISNSVRVGGHGSLDRHQWDAVAVQINRGELKEKEDDICSCIDSNYFKGLDNHAMRTGIIENECITFTRNGAIKKVDISNTLTANDPSRTLENNNPIIGVIENEIIQVGMLDESVMKGHELIRRVYSPEGLSPTLDSMCGGNRQPKIIEDFYANREIREFSDCPTIRADRQGLKVIEPKIVAQRGRYDENGDIKQQFEVQEGDFTNTITTVQKDNLVLVNQYRIRKLTPLECFRLMGFDDQDYYILKENGISNTQIYKMAGNSIVVNVLEEIFKNLF